MLHDDRMNKDSGRAGTQRNVGARVERHFIFKGENEEHILLEGSQALPVRPSDSNASK
jgi:hypothetical protein